MAQTGALLGAEAPGVLSMLRTSTDTGDVGLLAINPSRHPHGARQVHRKKGHPARLSDGSLRSIHTARAPKRDSNSALWEGRGLSRRGSISSLRTAKTMPPYFTDTLGPPIHPPPGRRLPPHPSPAPSSIDERSYSLTHTRMPHALAVQRSASSLRSQVSIPRMHPHHRQPYAPLPRGVRPGLRPVSPALSDYNPASGYPQGRYLTRPPMPAYHYDNAFQNQHMQAPRYAHGPPMPVRYLQSAPLSYHYEQQQRHVHPHMQQFPAANPRHGMMFTPTGRHVPGPHHEMSRVYVNRLESTPPSSVPSSSAPHSSNPSTPHDIYAELPENAVGFLGPMLDEAVAGNPVDGDEEQVVFSSYIAYADKASHAVEPAGGADIYAVSAHDVSDIPEIHELEAPSGPLPTSASLATLPPLPASRQTSTATMPQPAGFVQRIKDLLEQKAEGASQASPSPRSAKVDRSTVAAKAGGAAAEPWASPASPVSEATTGCREGPEVRLTRDLVKAFMSPSSSEHEISTAEATRDKRKSQYEPVLATISPERTSSEYPSDLIPDPEVADDNAPWHSSQGSISGESLTRDVDISVQQHDLHNAQHITEGNEKATAVADVGVTEVPLAREEPLVNVAQDCVNFEAVPAEVEGEGEVPAQEETPPASTPPQIEGASQTPVKITVLSTPQRGSRYIQVTDFKDDDDFNDGGAGITSDIVTDIAVRFSIPRHASMAKASVVRVSSVSERSARHSRLHREIHELPESVTPRSSVPGVEYVAPLQVNKHGKSDHDAPAFAQGADLSSFIRRTFPRRQSAFLREKSSSDQLDVETTHDGATKSGERHGLPYVKEESSEDISNVRSRPHSSSIDPVLEHQGLESDTMGLRSELTLSEVRNLPSLNFSNMNLADQLNAALGDRDSLPLDFFQKRKSSDIACPSSVKPNSTDSLRERYTSFFTKPEEFTVPSPAKDSESFSVETLLATRKDEDQKRVLLDHRSERPQSPPALTKFRPSPQLGRPLSPIELLDVAKEANRLSIPSVEGLSERLSEMLPSLKRFHMNSVIADDEALNHTLDEIHHLGDRPATTTSMRSSGVLRSLAAIADNIVTNGTHASQLLSKKPRLNKSLPPLPRDPANKSIESGEGQTEAEEDVSCASESSNDTIRPGVRRTRSESKGHTDPLGMTVLTPRRSITMHHSNSRPWNFDENYPWSSEVGLTTNLTADCTASRQERESIASHLLRVAANGHANETSPTSPGVDSTRSPGSGGSGGDGTSSGVSDLEPTATFTADTLTNKHHTRTLSKKASSLLGTLSRRAIKPPERPSTESIKRPGTVLSFQSRGNKEKKKDKKVTGSSGETGGAQAGKGAAATTAAHAVSDRYPLTSLQPPVGYDLDEVRSYFSSDAESTNEGRQGQGQGRGGRRSSHSRGVRREGTLGKGGQLRKRLSAGLRFNRTPSLRPASGMAVSAHTIDVLGGSGAEGLEGESSIMTAGGRGSRSLDFKRFAGGGGGGNSTTPTLTARSRKGRRASSGFWRTNAAGGSVLERTRGADGAIETASALGFGPDFSDSEDEDNNNDVEHHDEGVEEMSVMAADGGGRGTAASTNRAREPAPEGPSVRRPVDFYGRQSAGGGLGRVEFTVKRVGVRIRMALALGGRLLRRVSGRERRDRDRARRERGWVDGSASLYSGT